MPPRKILFATDATSFGGTAVVIGLLARLLPRERYAVTVALPDLRAFDPVVESLEAAGIPTERLLQIGDARPGAVAELRALIASTGAELIHLHLPYPGAGRWQLAAARASGIRVVATEHDPFPIGALKKLVKRLTLSWTHHTVVNSDWARELMLQEYGLPLDRVTRIWNGIEPGAWRSGEVRTEELRGFRAHAPVLFTNSALHPRKGLNSLIEAMRTVLAAAPQALLLIASGGPQQEELQDLAARLGVADGVRFLLHRTDVADLLATCDIAVQPSLREAFGLVVVEAMAAGKPVIATEVGGHVDTVVHGQTGLLVPPSDPEALAAAILALAGDPALRARMGAAGSARVDAEFTAARMAERTADLYDTVLA